MLSLKMYDLDEAWIEEHIALLRREGRAILFGGRVIEWKDIASIHIIHTDKTFKQIKLEQAPRSEIFSPDARQLERYGGTDVTNRFITGAPGTAQALTPSRRPGPALATDRKAVMVIYGHDREANAAMFSWLHDIGLQPKEWSQLINLSGSASPYIGDVLDRTFKSVQAVIAFFTPDERVRERGMDRPGSGPWRLQSRPNVLIEAGMALVTHPDRTVLVVLGPQELPSDLAGRHYIRLDGTPGSLNNMANRLQSAGCEIDQTGTHWLDPARFPNRDHIPANPPLTI
jgi:predicted nucleotide-binding protein